MELGVTKAELIQRMSKRKITAMDLEKYEPATTVAQIHVSGWFWRRPVHSSTSMDPAASQNPDISLRSAARLPLA
ncbi:hypothetical protein V5799_030526 [Amblyomma americanum]|uniref:Uncharacterized protein n=1 Tax=Amblyomma americanum TaxID=6943 RepID=A0AAQ4ENA6_AMBAM